MRRIISLLKSGFPEKALAILTRVDKNILFKKKIIRILKLTWKLDLAQIFEWLVCRSVQVFEIERRFDTDLMRKIVFQRNCTNIINMLYVSICF